MEKGWPESEDAIVDEWAKVGVLRMQPREWQRLKMMCVCMGDSYGHTLWLYDEAMGIIDDMYVR